MSLSVTIRKVSVRSKLFCPQHFPDCEVANVTYSLLMGTDTKVRSGCQIGEQISLGGTYLLKVLELRL